MSERFSWTEPTLCTYNNDLSKPWFVYFDYTDQLSGTTIRKQFRGPINSKKSIEERTHFGNTLKDYWKRQLKAGWNPFGDNLPILQPTIAEALETILALKQNNCSKRTMEAYRYSVRLLIDWLTKNRLNNIRVHQFEPHFARTYMDHLAINKGYSGRTWNDKLVNMATFFNCMVDRDWISKNPFAKIKKVPVGIGRNVAFTESEREALRAHLLAHDRPMYFFTQFVYYCFIRRSELTRLKVGNIDWQNMTIVIPSDASKNKKQESVVIPGPFVDILKSMGLDGLPQDWYIFGRMMKPGPVQYVNYNHISQRHNEISKAIGISPEKGLYSWKHSGVCSLYPKLNGDIYALMRQLRHSELTTTQIYLKSLGLVDNTAIRNAEW